MLQRRLKIHVLQLRLGTVKINKYIKKTQKTQQTYLQHFLNEHMLRTYYVPGTVSAGHTGMNMRGKVWTLRELTVGREDRW